MDFPGLSKLSKSASLLLPAGKKLALKAGEIVEGKVLKRLSASTILIQLKNQNIEAKTEIPLSPGDIIRFQVALAAGQIRLKRLGLVSGAVSLEQELAKILQGFSGSTLNAAEINRILMQLKHLPAPIRKLLPDLSVLDSFMQNMAGLSGEQLKKLFESSGLFFEAKLKRQLLLENGAEASTAKHIIQGDLKGTLLAIADLLQNKQVQVAFAKFNMDQDELLDAIQTLLKQISCNQVQSKLNDISQIFLPFLGKWLKEGSMVFRQSEEDQSLPPEERRYACTLHLELEKAGKLSTHIQMQAGRFYLRFIAENRAFVTLLQEQTAVLKQQLTAAGIPCAAFVVSHQEKILEAQALSDRIDVRI